MASIKKIEGKGGVSYKITVSMGRDAHDKQIRHYKTWKPDQGMTTRQIERELKRIAYEFERDLQIGFQADNRQTFEQYAEYVIDLKEREGAAKNTIKIYRNFAKRIYPLIGSIKISAIRPQHLNNLYKELGKVGGKKVRNRAYPKIDFGKMLVERGESWSSFAKKCGICIDSVRTICGGQYIGEESAWKIVNTLGGSLEDYFTVEQRNDILSPKTIQRVHGFISIVLSQAEMEMIIQYNPAEKVTPPYCPPHEPNYFQPEEIEKILDAVDREPIKWRTMFHLFIVTGARRGEILALKWVNVDFENNQIYIDGCLSYLPGIGKYEGPTKTRKSRYITLPAETMGLLRKYRAWQTEQRIRYGEDWTETGHVFTAERGGPLLPTSVNSRLIKFSKNNGLPHINPHAFRHSAASIMIASGIDVLTVSKMLGHANTSTTTDFYGHAIEEAKRKATECIANAILRKKNA